MVWSNVAAFDAVDVLKYIGDLPCGVVGCFRGGSWHVWR
jgi:hypothetical protein